MMNGHKLTPTPRTKIRAMLQDELANAEFTCLDDMVKIIKTEHGTFVELKVDDDIILKLGLSERSYCISSGVYANEQE